jgi:fumarate reductase iron-sulfur subunit
MGEPIKVNIRRYDPEQGAEPFWQSYEVPRQRATRVLDVLEYIQDELDPGLGYRRHICHNLVCRSCMVLVNGHSRLTCQSLIRPDVVEIKLEPLDGHQLIRDLIVIMDDPA